MNAIKKETLLTLEKIKEYNDQIVELNELKEEIYIKNGIQLIDLLEEQVKKDIKNCTYDRYMLVLLSIQNLILSGRSDSRFYMPVNSNNCEFARLIKILITKVNDITTFPTDFMSEYKEIYTIYTCMVNLELEFRKE